MDRFVGRGPRQKARVAERTHDVAGDGEAQDQEANYGHDRVGNGPEKRHVEAYVKTGRYEYECENARHHDPISAGVTAAITEELSTAWEYLPVRD